jgi:hypothetical protein
VDNFVDSFAALPAKPYFSRLWTFCPEKKQKSKSLQIKHLRQSCQFVDTTVTAGFIVAAHKKFCA